MADQPDRSLRSMMTVITLPKVPNRRMRERLILPNHPPSSEELETGMASRTVWSLSRPACLIGDSVVVLVTPKEEWKNTSIV